MRQKSVIPIQDQKMYLKRIFKNFTSLNSNYHEFRLPTLEEISFFNDKISLNLTNKIWFDDRNDKRNKYMYHEQKGGSLDEIFLNKFKLKIPIINSAKLILIQYDIFSNNRFNCIASINTTNLSDEIKTEFYEFSYEKRTKSKLKKTNSHLYYPY